MTNERIEKLGVVAFATGIVVAIDGIDVPPFIVFTLTCVGAAILVFLHDAFKWALGSAIFIAAAVCASSCTSDKYILAGCFAIFMLGVNFARLLVGEMKKEIV